MVKQKRICKLPGRPAYVGPCPPKPNPLGGPSSGLWPQGSSPATATPSCVTARLLADCFGACSGSIPPGSVCGWSFSEAFGAFGGSVSFVPGQMTLASAAAVEFPAASKGASAPISIFGLTAQIKFVETATVPPGGGAIYLFYIMDQAAANVLLIAMNDTGSFVIQVGPVGGAQEYSGSWTPDNGAHTLHVTTTALGVPSFFIDGVAIPLTPTMIVAPLLGTLTANSFTVFFAPNVAGSHTAAVRQVSLTQSILGPDTEFCCPA